MQSQIEQCFNFLFYKFFDIYYDIEDMVSDLFYKKERISYNYLDKNYLINVNNYVIIDSIKNIAFFENYDGTYKKKII